MSWIYPEASFYYDALADISLNPDGGVIIALLPLEVEIM